MKIAVFHNLPSGGAKRALHGLIEYLSSSGNIVDAYVPETADESFLPLDDVVNNVYTFKVKRTLKNSLLSRYHHPTVSSEVNFNDLEDTQRIIAENINSKDYHVVLSEQDRFTMAPFFLKYIKIPAVYYCQQPPRTDAILNNVSKAIKDEKTSIKDKIFQIIDRRATQRELKMDKENMLAAKYILANSYFSRESILRTYGLNSFVSYLGIDTSIFKPIKTESEDFVLSVGTCTPSKGYDFIIRSLSLIEREIRPKLIIVSNAADEAWESYLNELAINCGVDMQILKLIDDHKLVELYNKAKMVVYAPYLEPFGLVSIEAMGCGTPVVGVKEGGLRETVIHNKTGILTQRDESLFADAIKKFIKYNGNEMSKLSVDTVKKYWTLEHAGKRLENHLNRASKNTT